MATKTTRQRARTGRPTKLTERVAEAIIESVRNGNYIETRRAGRRHPPRYAAQLACAWRGRGQRNALFVEFFGALTRAEAEAEERAVKALGDAFTDDWRAASEYLRRRHPDRWSTQDRIHGQVKHEREREVSDQLDREIERLIAELGAPGEGASAAEGSR